MILKRLFAYFSIILMATACYKYNKPKKPENLISKDKMIDIIMDVRLLSSANGQNKSTLQKNNVQAEAYIYKKYNIDSLQFALSNDYYAYYVDDYEAIYAKVRDSLEGLKSKFADLQFKEEKEKRYRDSIQNIIKKDSIRISKLKDHIGLLVKKDATKALIKKDSIRLVKMKDSLNMLVKKDSVTRFKLKAQTEAKLITPVSDIDFQQ